jgi:hypothetical protein
MMFFINVFFAPIIYIINPSKTIIAKFLFIIPTFFTKFCFTFTTIKYFSDFHSTNIANRHLNPNIWQMMVSIKC